MLGLQDRFLAERREMVRIQLRGRGIRDPRLLAAFERVPRHRFVPESLVHRAHEDQPLAIGHGQTTAQPYILACMTEALGLGSDARVLEVGTGSGYQTAVLAEMAADVHTVEWVGALADGARGALERLGYANVRYRTGDGSAGWPEAGPYDGILVTAAAPRVPGSLVAQLRDGGTLVAPVGTQELQTLVAVTRRGKKLRRRELCNCLFVQLLVKGG